MTTIQTINNRINRMTDNSNKIKQLSKQAEQLIKEEIYDEEEIIHIMKQITYLKSENKKIKHKPLQFK